MSKRCQDCKFWRKEIPQDHWSYCDTEQVKTKMENGKRIYYETIGEIKTSRYSRKCFKFQQKDFSRKWKV
jgi:hypothetical protein